MLAVVGLSAVPVLGSVEGRAGWLVRAGVPLVISMVVVDSRVDTMSVVLGAMVVVVIPGRRIHCVRHGPL